MFMGYVTILSLTVQSESMSVGFYVKRTLHLTPRVSCTCSFSRVVLHV